MFVQVFVNGAVVTGIVGSSNVLLIGDVGRLLVAGGMVNDLGSPELVKVPVGVLGIVLLVGAIGSPLETVPGAIGVVALGDDVGSPLEMVPGGVGATYWL